MNRKVIIYILGYVIFLEGILMLLPVFAALIYKEGSGVYFFVIAFLCVLLGGLLILKKPDNYVFYLKEGCFATACSWILLSLFGCLPFCLSGQIPSFTDALFETISGFTTTGASILSDVESMDRCMLFWRSFTHWIGGMGVLVFLLAIVPLNGGSNINLMKAESPGPSVGKLVPKMKHTARILYVIYFVLTVVEFVLLVIGKMPVFHAFCTAFGTAGTGGFGTLNDSFASFSPYIQWVVTIFMILFGVNFNAYYLILFGKIRKALKMEEVRHYFIIIAAAVLIIFINLMGTAMAAGTAFRAAAFQVASIITTTGFCSVDFDLWSQMSRTVLVILMFIGACAGSTGGGIKVSRFVILAKTVAKEMNSFFHPKSVKKIKMDDKPIEHDVVRTVNVYFVTFIIVFTASVFLISVDGKGLVTNFTAVAATINNIGPGLEMVGPTGNFGSFSGFSKYILMYDMLAGRLELFPMLIMLHPAIWKELFAGKKGKTVKRRTNV